MFGIGGAISGTMSFVYRLYIAWMESPSEKQAKIEAKLRSINPRWKEDAANTIRARRLAEQSGGPIIEHDPS